MASIANNTSFEARRKCGAHLRVTPTLVNK